MAIDKAEFTERQRRKQVIMVTTSAPLRILQRILKMETGKQVKTEMIKAKLTAVNEEKKDENTIKKIEKKKRKKMSLETRRKIGESMSGRICSKEIREKISAKMKGKIPWNKGRKMSDSTRQKMSEAKLGIEPWNRGKTLSETHKESIAIALSKRRLDDSTKARMRAARRLPFDTLISAGMKKEKKGIEYGVLGWDVINEYVTLRKELRDWSDRFTQRVRHRPSISDVRKTAPPRIIRKFEVYLDLKEKVRGLAREVIGTVNPNHIPVIAPVSMTSEPLVADSTRGSEEQHDANWSPPSKSESGKTRKGKRNSSKVVSAKLSPNDYRAIGRYRLMETVDIHRYKKLRKELRVWSNRFKAEHGRTPALSDVQALGDSVVYHKFCEYLDFKQKMSGLLSEVHNGKIDEETIDQVTAKGKRILKMLRNGVVEDNSHPQAPRNVNVNEVLSSTTLSQD